MAQRALTADDWIKAGFRALSTHGENGLRAERLAKLLGATKGSFYWHFKDVPDFHTKMIETWEEAGTRNIMLAVGNDAAGMDALRKLFTIIGQTIANNPYGGNKVEPAIREWGKTNRLVRSRVLAVDRKRINYVAELLTAAGQSQDAATLNSRLLYAALVGMETMGAQKKIDIGAEMLRLLDRLLK